MPSKDGCAVVADAFRKELFGGVSYFCQLSDYVCYVGRGVVCFREQIAVGNNTGSFVIEFLP